MSVREVSYAVLGSLAVAIFTLVGIIVLTIPLSALETLTRLFF